MNTITDIKKGRLPGHLVIIMDGNGRWARKRRLPRIAGHAAARASVRDVVAAGAELGAHPACQAADCLREQMMTGLTAEVTKSVAATLIGVAIQRGMIAGVDVPVFELLSSYDLDAVDPRVREATLEDLLTGAPVLDVMTSLYFHRLWIARYSDRPGRQSTARAYERLFGKGYDARDIVRHLPRFLDYELSTIDDLGFAGTSTFGGAVDTPTFDRLAKGGLRYNNFHTTALCSPTRVALKSGLGLVSITAVAPRMATRSLFIPLHNDRAASSTLPGGWVQSFAAPIPLLTLSG